MMSGVESKPASKGRIKTSQSEAGYSYQFFRFIKSVFRVRAEIKSSSQRVFEP
jgi:hypothetical protein